jgi:hypothetical protein
MTDRLYASFFYVVFIVGSSWIAISVGETLARSALTKLALLPSQETQPSRVDAFLTARERNTEPVAATAKEPLIPSAPSVTAGALAKAMDEAEQSRPDPTDDEKASTDAKPEVAVPEAQKPRVAGWSKRLPKRALSIAVPEETSSHIIMRSLRAQM